jgi:cation diffusion facilitator CzcD-associated flavoprotein CzcO
MAQPSPAEDRSVHVAVLGAGMSGICMGYYLRKHGIEDFVIIEKADAVGGTWRENTYPGIACDVPSHVYSFSFELNPDWSHGYGGGAEIWDYCERCVDKFGLRPHLRLGSHVDSLQFDGNRWTVAISDGSSVTADVVVSGLGGLHRPSHPDIDGMDTFNGTTFHTAEWNHDHDLTGRNIAIIGTGASGAQVLPEVAEQAASVTVFQRSAAWVFPRLTREIPEARRESFRRHPWRMRLYRWFLWTLLDVAGVLSLKRNGILSDRLKRTALNHLEESVQDPEVRAKLTPEYVPGCKRRCISDDYLSSFNRDNVHLVTDGIVAIEANGIRDATGTLHEVDTIIEATGFKPFDISSYVDIRGRDGRPLRDVWSEHIESFRTMMVPGFPNFFMLLGPNSATGHTSALIMIESAARYVIQSLRLMERKRIRHLDPDPAKVTRYNQRLQNGMDNMVFSGGCNSWYTDDSDQNFTLWPYSAFRFLFEQWKLKRSDFRTG